MTKRMIDMVKNDPEIDRYYCYTENIFDFKLVFLPNRSYNPSEYAESLHELGKDIFLSKQEITYWENNTLFQYPYTLINKSGCVVPYQVYDTVECFKTFEKYILSYPKNLPFCGYRPIDIISEITCRKIFESAIDFLRYISIPWLDVIKLEWIKNLGAEYDNLLKKAEEFFFMEANYFKKTEAFSRKLQVLRECFYVDCRVIWVRQLEHLAENLRNSFKHSTSTLVLDDRFEQGYNNLINSFNKEFNSKAQSIIPGYNKGSWNYSYYRNKFLKSIRVFMELKMKTGYFKGILVRKRKQPISVWFHALFPHPFGKDLNSEPLSEDDPFLYEENKERNNSKANLMRYIIQKPKPHQKHDEKNLKIVGKIKKEDFVFKEKPKKALKRFEYN
jgi:hypothetical protein